MDELEEIASGEWLKKNDHRAIAEKCQELAKILKQTRTMNAQLRNQLNASLQQQARQYRDNQDFLPYDDGDRDR